MRNRRLLAKHKRVWLDPRDAGPLAGLVAITVTFSLLAPSFLSLPNVVSILQHTSINACAAIGMTFVIVTGGIDLSVGSIAALSAVVTATMMTAGSSLIVSLSAGLLVGIACGTLNGALISLARLQPFVVTLGTRSLFRALALIVTGGNPVLTLPAEFRNLFTADLGFTPASVVLVAALSLIFWFVLNRTAFGEYVYALGGNEEAARAAGVPIISTRVGAYVISGGLAYVASLILIARLGAAEPILGDLWELNAIAAAAIGGASLLGGRGSILGTLVGALILGTLQNGLILTNVQAFYQLLVTGTLIIVATLADRYVRRH